MKVAAMNVMQMDHIRLEPFQLPNQAQCPDVAAVPLRVQEFTDSTVKLALQSTPNAKGEAFQSLWRVFRAIPNAAFVPLGFQKKRDIRCDPPRALDTAKGI